MDLNGQWGDGCRQVRRLYDDRDQVLICFGGVLLARGPQSSLADRDSMKDVIVAADCAAARDEKEQLVDVGWVSTDLPASTYAQDGDRDIVAAHQRVRLQSAAAVRGDVPCLVWSNLKNPHGRTIHAHARRARSLANASAHRLLV